MNYSIREMFAVQGEVVLITGQTIYVDGGWTVS